MFRDSMWESLDDAFAAMEEHTRAEEITCAEFMQSMEPVYKQHDLGKKNNPPPTLCTHTIPQAIVFSCYIYCIFFNFILLRYLKWCQNQRKGNGSATFRYQSISPVTNICLFFMFFSSFWWNTGIFIDFYKYVHWYCELVIKFFSVVFFFISFWQFWLREWDKF